jgi:hypothetical protein
MMRPVAVLAIAAAAFALAGCGERPQVVNYKQGSYQGKPDTKPWSNAPYSGNQQEWDNAIRQRNQAQNEYKRIGG